MSDASKYAIKLLRREWYTLNVKAKRLAEECRDMESKLASTRTMEQRVMDEMADIRQVLGEDAPLIYADYQRLGDEANDVIRRHLREFGDSTAHIDLSELEAYGQSQ